MNRYLPSIKETERRHTYCLKQASHNVCHILTQDPATKAGEGCLKLLTALKAEHFSEKRANPNEESQKFNGSINTACNKNNGFEVPPKNLLARMIYIFCEFLAANYSITKPIDLKKLDASIQSLLSDPLLSDGLIINLSNRDECALLLKKSLLKAGYCLKQMNFGKNSL